MVAIISKDLFQRSKDFFQSGDIANSIETYESLISKIDRNRDDSTEYITFLENLLKYCREKNLQEEEALVLRAMGRTYSIFKKYVESLKHHWQSLKIQRKLGKNMEIAEGLVFIAQDLEISGEYDDAIKSYQEALVLFRNLGKIKKVREIEKELKRLEEVSREIVEDEYFLSKFHINDV
ncbi:MAG: tetratricopeptide repeat protein [Candidatus Lokiarchaeota archaeon]